MSVSDNITNDRYALAELMEMTAEELERRAQKLIKHARLLRDEAAATTPAPAAEERSIGRGGVIVTEKEAIAAARDLGEFTRAQFAETLHLSPSAVSRWLTKLLEREHPVIERRSTGQYAYLPPPASAAPPRRHAVERELITDAPQRGAAVHVLKPRKRAKAINVAGQGHLIKQRDARRAKLEAGKRK